MENRNWFYSDKYKKMIANTNKISKGISLKLNNVFQDNLKMGSMLKMNDNTKWIRSQVQILSRFSNQLSSVIPSFQLSEEIKEYIREAKASEGLSEEEFEKKYGEELAVCKMLGENGWVVSGYSNPRNIVNWHSALLEHQPEKIIAFFEEGDECVIKNITADLEYRYDDPANRNYYSRGIKAFRDNDYMTSAMYLVALVEEREKRLVQFSPNVRSYKDKYSNKGFRNIKQEQFAETNSFFTKRYYFLDVYPSLIAFLNRLFVDGEYTFERGVEPPYINRNWLLHGKCCREIERFECIQLLNALETIENVLGDKKKEGDLSDEQYGENEI